MAMHTNFRRMIVSAPSLLGRPYSVGSSRLHFMYSVFVCVVRTPNK
jgi:hypothetical protein